MCVWQIDLCTNHQKWLELSQQSISDRHRVERKSDASLTAHNSERRHMGSAITWERHSARPDLSNIVHIQSLRNEWGHGLRQATDQVLVQWILTHPCCGGLGARQVVVVFLVNKKSLKRQFKPHSTILNHRLRWSKRTTATLAIAYLLFHLQQLDTKGLSGLHSRTWIESSKTSENISASCFRLASRPWFLLVDVCRLAEWEKSHQEKDDFTHRLLRSTHSSGPRDFIASNESMSTNQSLRK